MWEEFYGFYCGGVGDFVLEENCVLLFLGYV